MSVETLRRAARQMRERAKGATPGPWRQDGVSDSQWNDQVVADHRSGNPLWAEFVADTDTSDENATHIASWHPAVALAVADWLDGTADAIDAHLARQADPEIRFHGTWTAVAESTHAHALTVARTYLGEQP